MPSADNKVRFWLLSALVTLLVSIGSCAGANLVAL